MTPQEIKARLGRQFMLGSQGDRLAQEVALMLSEQKTEEMRPIVHVSNVVDADTSDALIQQAREEGSAVGMMTMAGWAALHIGGAEPDEGFPEAPDDVKELLAGIKQEALGGLVSGDPVNINTSKKVSEGSATMPFTGEVFQGQAPPDYPCVVLCTSPGQLDGVDALNLALIQELLCRVGETCRVIIRKPATKVINEPRVQLTYQFGPDDAPGFVRTSPDVNTETLDAESPDLTDLVSQEDADQLSEQAKTEGYTAGFRDGAVAAKDAAIVAADQVKVAATGPSIKAGINKAIEAIEDINLESLEK
jgi:hypothetical protein